MPGEVLSSQKVKIFFLAEVLLMQGCGHTMPNLFHFFEDKQEINLSWDKDFIALAKKSIQIINFSYFSKKTYLVGTD